MLSSTCHHNNLMFLKHSWVKFVRHKFIVIWPISQNVIFTHSPRIHFVCFAKNSIAILTFCLDLSTRFLDLINIIFLLKICLPEAFEKVWSVEICNVLQVLFFFHRGRLLLFSCNCSFLWWFLWRFLRRINLFRMSRLLFSFWWRFLNDLLFAFFLFTFFLCCFRFCLLSCQSFFFLFLFQF